MFYSGEFGRIRWNMFYPFVKEQIEFCSKLQTNDIVFPKSRWGDNTKTSRTISKIQFLYSEVDSNFQIIGIETNNKPACKNWIVTSIMLYTENNQRVRSCMVKTNEKEFEIADLKI